MTFYQESVVFLVVLFASAYCVTHDNVDNAKRLYEHLTRDYNRLIRPVSNNTDKLVVRLGLKLSQLLDVVSKSRGKKYTDRRTDGRTHTHTHTKECSIVAIDTLPL